MNNRRQFLQQSIFGLPLLAAGLTACSRQSAGMRYEKPVIVSTWDNGVKANAAGWPVLKDGGRALDAVEQAARAIEDSLDCCVGLQANPDRDGRVTLDASIMDEKANCGSVAFLQHIKHPISVARKVMESTPHVMLAGEGALRFALANGFAKEPDVLSADAEKRWKEWLKESKYEPVVNIENQKQAASGNAAAPTTMKDGSPNHDTMGVLALDGSGNLSGACTTSGMAFKVHGRVGDSPIIGAGLYVDNEIGAATSSGVGEEVIRLCGTHLVIELMRQGRTPEAACREACERIVRRDPEKARTLQVGFLALSRTGEVGAYAIQKGFTFTVTHGGEAGKIHQAASLFA